MHAHLLREACLMQPTSASSSTKPNCVRGVMLSWLCAVRQSCYNCAKYSISVQQSVGVAAAADLQASAGALMWVSTPQWGRLGGSRMATGGW